MRVGTVGTAYCTLQKYESTTFERATKERSDKRAPRQKSAATKERRDKIA
jgi:hypothetical protein